MQEPGANLLVLCGLWLLLWSGSCGCGGKQLAPEAASANLTAENGSQAPQSAATNSSHFPELQPISTALQEYKSPPSTATQEYKPPPSTATQKYKPPPSTAPQEYKPPPSTAPPRPPKSVQSDVPPPKMPLTPASRPSDSFPPPRGSPPPISRPHIPVSPIATGSSSAIAPHQRPAHNKSFESGSLPKPPEAHIPVDSVQPAPVDSTEPSPPLSPSTSAGPVAANSVRESMQPFPQAPGSSLSPSVIAALQKIGHQPAVAPSVFDQIASEASTGTANETSVDAELEIQGAGVTPFDADNQELVINAFSFVMTTVTRADYLIRYYTSDSSQVPVRLGRRLLQGAEAQPEAALANTVFVTLQINAGSYDGTPAVIADVQAGLTQQGPYNVVPLQASHRIHHTHQALQAYGQPAWSLSLLSINAVDPTQPLAVELVCATKFGSICLDGSGLSQGAVKAIIAVGVIVIVFSVSSACVIVDLLRRTGRMGELEMHPDTPRTPMQKAVNSLNTYLRSALAAVRTPRGSAQRGTFAPDNPPPRPPGTPVTATAAIAGSKQVMGKGGSLGGSTVVVDTAPPEELSNDSARDHVQDAPPEGADQLAAGPSAQPAAITNVAGASTGSVASASEEGTNLK